MESDMPPARPASFLQSDMVAVMGELIEVERKLEGLVLSVRWARMYLDRLQRAETSKSGATVGMKPAESGHSGPAALDPASGEG